MLVAVYGTLKKGFSNHVLLKDANFKGELILGGFDMYSCGGFPTICKGHGKILCEIWKVTKHEISKLDSLEGHPSWYERIQVPTIFGWVWIYTMTHKQCSGLPLVEKQVGIFIWK